MDGGKNKLKGGVSLQSTCADHAPETFDSFPSHFAARTLCDARVDNHETHCLFSNVVGRAHARRGDECEVGLEFFTEPLGHVEGFPLLLLAVFIQAGGNVIECGIHDFFTGVSHLTVKGIRREIFTVICLCVARRQVDDHKHLLHRGDQLLFICFNSFF